MKQNCKQCGKEFELTESEINFYKSKNLNIPKRCKDCREKNRAVNGNNEVSKTIAPGRKTYNNAPVKSYGNFRAHNNISPVIIAAVCILVLVVAFIFVKNINGKNSENQSISYDSSLNNNETSVSNNSELDLNDTADLNASNIPESETDKTVNETLSDDEANDEIKTGQALDDEISIEKVSDEKVSDVKSLDEKVSDEKVSDEKPADTKVADDKTVTDNLQAAKENDNEANSNIEATDTVNDNSITNTNIESAATESTTTTVTPTAAIYKFRNSKLLNDHYEKHGIEMGFPDAQSYEAAAARVISNPATLRKTEKEDGDFVFYLEATNEFVILSTDGYIRTYFLPSGGKAYYDRQ